MNVRSIFRMCKLLPPLMFSRRAGTYKYVKRPDPKTLKMPTPETTLPSLMEILKQKIKLRGCITVADFMHIVITNPHLGYYMKKNTIGETGDFVTSPEISQLFGEMVGIWFYAETMKMSAGKPLQIVELGPGKATLMTDILRVLHKIGYSGSDLSIHLVEISETMQNIQAHQLCFTHKATDIEKPHNYEGETLGGIKVYWYNDMQKVPKNFSWYIAHEFFDVLPIHKFEKTEKGWREILIDVDKDGKLRYRISAEETPAAKMYIKPPLDTGDRTALEISGRGLGIARQLSDRVDKYGGIAFIADYGHEGEKGDTFRAFHKHTVVDPLEMVGQCDLTADVDFSQLRIAASKTLNHENYSIVLGPVKQKDFLERMQAPARLQVLIDNAKSEEEKEKLKSAYDMLVNPNKMGERFKFMAFYPSQAGEILEKYPPLGFVADYPSKPK